MRRDSRGLADDPVKVRPDPVLTSLFKGVTETTPGEGDLFRFQFFSRYWRERLCVVVGQVFSCQQPVDLGLRYDVVGPEGDYTEPDLWKKHRERQERQQHRRMKNAGTRRNAQVPLSATS